MNVAGSGEHPSFCGGCDGAASVIATGGTPPYTYLWSTGETTSGIGASQAGTPLCINAGGSSFNASNGNTFTADQYSSGGTSFSNLIPIANTLDDAIFQDERYVGNGGFFSYNIPVTNGNYLVELYFAEIYFGTSPTRPGGVGSRLFDVSIEGALVLDDYDIFLDAGGAAIAVIKSFNANVTDGTLNILFDGVVNNAKINAVCVTPVSSNGLCAGEYFVTVTDNAGCVASTSVVLDEGACDDGNACTTDACQNAQCVYTAIECDDSDSCTVDACVSGICEYTPIPGCGDPCDNILCDDEDLCTMDVCVNGTCEFTPLNCYDGDLCTIDSCFGTQCIYIPISCDDGDSCTIDECGNGQCFHNPIAGCGDPCATTVCFDNDACTADACSNGQCIFTPIDCNDNDACTDDACLGGCLNTPLNCDDSDSCTTDLCSNGVCSHNAIPGCSPCTNVTCNDSDPCTSDACVNGQCEFTPVDCDDNDACTVDVCAGACFYTPVNCDDNDACTDDACTNGCVYTPTTCDDGDLCTTDACQNGCQYQPINCDDGDVCTADSCNNGVCFYTPIAGCIDPCVNLNCDDNDACTADGCVNGVCVYTSPCDDSDACTFDFCQRIHHGAGYKCRYRDLNCDDGNSCTLDECDNGVCINTPIICDDNDACTIDECKYGRCKYRDNTCDDNDACTTDACDNGVCINTPRDCDDNDLCTIDVCVPGDDDDDCDDDHDHDYYDDGRTGGGWWGNWGGHGGTHCIHLPIQCNDFIACTHDACDSTGNCMNTQIPGCCTSDADCDDEDACTLDKCFRRQCSNSASVLELTVVSGFCQNGKAIIEPSETGVTYAWSSGDTTSRIEGLPGAIYSVTITQANGCVKSASITVPARQKLLSSYVMLTEEEIKLTKNTVASGGVGVTDYDGEIRLRNHTMITAAGTFAHADDIQVSPSSQVTTSIPTPATVVLPRFESNPYCNYNNGASITVPPNQTVTLNGSVYGTITVNKNATVLFTSPDLYVRNLITKDNSTLKFADCTRMRLCKQMRLGDNTVFNPDSAAVVVFAEDDVEIGSGCFVFADIYVDNDDIEVYGSSSSNPGRLIGLFIAEDIEAKENTYWYMNPNCSLCGNAQQPFALKTQPETSETLSAIFENNTSAVHLNAYPNPFTDNIFIEFSLPEDMDVKLEIFNLAGQRIARLFEGSVTGGTLQRFTYQASGSEGMLIYRLQTKNGIYFGKAVNVN